MTLPRLLLLPLFSLAAIAQEGVTASKSETVATLTDTRIKESSGLARSLRLADEPRGKRVEVAHMRIDPPLQPLIVAPAFDRQHAVQFRPSRGEPHKG